MKIITFLALCFFSISVYSREEAQCVRIEQVSVEGEFSSSVYKCSYIGYFFFSFSNDLVLAEVIEYTYGKGLVSF